MIETRVEEALINKARLYQNIRKITENRTSRFMQMVSISTRILFTCLYVLVMSSCKIATIDPESTGTSQAISTTQLVPTLELTYTPTPLVTLIASQVPTSFPPRGRIVFEVDVGEAGIYAMDADGRNLEQLVEHVGEDETARPTWSPDGKTIAYLSNSGNQERQILSLWLMSYDGSYPKRLTNRNHHDYGYSFSPDGQYIVLSSGQSRPDGNEKEIYIISHSGSIIRRLTDDHRNDDSPSWSPDGEWIAFTSHEEMSGGFDLVIIRADGSQRTLLTNEVLIAPTSSSISWAPDSNSIAAVCDYEGNYDICVFPTDGEKPIRLTRAASIDIHPAWSPGGQAILYISNTMHDGTVKEDFISISPDGSSSVQLTDFPTADGIIYYTPPPVWSPDGQHIAFVSQRGKSDDPQDIFVMNVDGSGMTQITFGLGYAIESLDWVMP